ncbi:type III-B CRISPR module-associated protein Cmr5 [Paenibacillus albidus]|uniref:type III-B CRISPR module-associated protein Cmr5 n=1 Tax=Paenibacillus albidus TaxID=2041023 RepID=UPI001BE8A068|nr:type III-B CRISPR module-associated protein Cmr5 [Paenibacillus albidus]MBT2288284.1 type III-B CRISPR module-associated protein Cmr5 [Paenibacillus albidus]
MKSVAHTYAEKALKSIRAVEADVGCNSKDYGRVCLLFPSMVQVNGLRLTVAFFESKGKNNSQSVHLRFLNDLVAALDIKSFDDEFTTNNMTDYRDLTQRALQASVWFKRYAEAILKVEAADVMDNE